jgi:Flp pilus assembly protein TadB
MQRIRIEVKGGRSGGQGPGTSGPGGTLARIAAFVIGAIVLVFAAVIGGFVLAAIIGLALIAWLVIYVRMWWLGRDMRRKGQGEEFVEAEYRVVDSAPEDDEVR